MGGAVVAVHAIHLAHLEASAIGFGVGGGEDGFLAVYGVFDPGDGLAGLVGVAIADEDFAGPAAEVRAMDANAVVAAADLHEEDGLGVGVGFVLGEFGDDLQAVLPVLL